MSKLLDRIITKVKHIDRKHGSKILLAGGIISSVAAVGLTVKKSFKAADIIDNHNAYREKIDEELPEEEYTEEARKKAVRKLYFSTGVELAKCYALPVGLEIASLGMFCGAFGKEREAKLGYISALNSVTTMFTGYRKAIAEKIGEEAEKDIYYGAKHTKVKNEETKKNEEVVILDPEDPNRYSVYSRFFDELNPCWQNDPLYNMTWLKQQQTIWSDKLRRDKVVFLNDVYSSLGFERIPEGQAIGWAMEAGDDYIDFGIWDGRREKVRDFVNGYEPSILLTFPNLSGKSVVEYI